MRTFIRVFIIAPLFALHVAACSSADPTAAAPKTCTLDKSKMLPILSDPGRIGSTDVLYKSTYTAHQLLGEALSNDADGYVHIRVDACDMTFPTRSSTATPPNTACRPYQDGWIMNSDQLWLQGLHTHVAMSLVKHLDVEGTDIACTFADGSPAVESHDDDL